MHAVWWRKGMIGATPGKIADRLDAPIRHLESVNVCLSREGSVRRRLVNGMLDVAIGLTFVYLLLSLLCSTVIEALEQGFKYRAYYLRIGIERLLFGGDTRLREQLYAHPLVKSLYTDTRLPGFVRTTGPSYIPSRQFVLALLDIVAAHAPAPRAVGAVQRMQDLVDGLARNEKQLPAALVGALRSRSRAAPSSGSTAPWIVSRAGTSDAPRASR
jgi:hypothetical protein